MQIISPSRICLFGEHQDYLGLPILSMAIDKYTFFTIKINNNKRILINKLDLNEIENFSIVLDNSNFLILQK